MPTISSYLENISQFFWSLSSGQLKGKLAALPGASPVARHPLVSMFGSSERLSLLVSRLLYNNCTDV